MVLLHSECECVDGHAKKARVSVDPAGAAAAAVCPTVTVAVGEDRVNEGGGEGGTGRVDEEDEGADEEGVERREKGVLPPPPKRQ